MKLTLLHLSDFHANVKDLSHIQKIRKGLLNDLTKMEERGVKPNFVFFTGDLINRGENSEVEFKLVAGEIIEPLLDKLGLNQDALFTIPGNHEIDRKKTYVEIEAGLEHHLKNNDVLNEYHDSCVLGSPNFGALENKLSGYTKFAAAYKNQHVVAESFFYNAYRAMIGKLSVGIVGLNSAWRSSGYGSDDKRLLIGEKIVEQASMHITDCDLKICLCHHPFEMLCEWDSKKVRRRMAKSFDFLFTGHVHDSDVMYMKQVLGGMTVFTSGCLNSQKSNFYSLVDGDLSEKRVTVYLRKWYADRGEFDQETEKAADGLVVLEGFKCGNPETADLIEINELRGKLQELRRTSQIINPLEGVIQLTLRDVFVEPVISNTSTFEKEQELVTSIGLNDLFITGENLLLFGRPEYGKTALLEYIYNFILQDDEHFEGKIPVFIKFAEVPKNNPDSLRHIIRHHLEDIVDRDAVEKYLVQGRFIILVDDFNERQDEDRHRRVACLKQFTSKYSKCRYILTLTEYISQTFHYEALVWNEGFNPVSYYITSFTTAKIRQLIIKINTAQRLDVNAILDQIIFYFQQLQIPITPLAVTLFVGVLFRDQGKKNIQNEAYLIENYLETILEKLNPDDRSSVLDFREKEGFLSHIAYRMVEKKVFEWDMNEFEREKLNYFDGFDEDVPSGKLFDDFFQKGILQKLDRKVSFKFKFWFNFFLAKAMEKDDRRKLNVLNLSEYLNYATALSYKAGLSRNDEYLLAQIDERINSEIKAVIPSGMAEFSEGIALDELLGDISGNVGKELTERSNQQEADKFRDQTLPSADESQQIEAVEDCDKIGQLLTLHSDIVRNTRELDPQSKAKYVKSNLEAYVRFMWASLSAFQSLLSVTSVDDLPKLLGQGITSKKQEVRLKRMVESSSRMVLQIVPLSVIFYMMDHLGSPKLVRPVSKLEQNERNEVKRVFYLALLFKLDQPSGVQRMKEFIRKSKSIVCDYLIFTFLRVFSFENDLSGQPLAQVIEVLESIRTKYQTSSRRLPPFLTDRFTPEFKKRINLKRMKSS